MSAEYVRSYYKVPAARGMRVCVDGRPGVIAGFSGAHLKVRFDGDRVSKCCHPTWRVEYLTGDALTRPRFAS
ncbi:hypothetical protein [Allonocardiopsis opalescens]|uniref:Uncharacterized protein n=1 Tax=Allonocardiopsis opalescens TaxID=1144618 RepID=A0A2T0PP34_9ACTN|nr:hypothetical protein [Allonocardiopsis opalescens]PRX90665.1 hypothetical protein CLV72_1183 [Allonocardiopsis opalescens]